MASSTPKASECLTIKHDDGTMKLAYDGKPLNLYAVTSKPGDR